MCEKCRRDCESCQSLLKKYDEDDLAICEHCSHYYIQINGSCHQCAKKSKDKKFTVIVNINLEYEFKGMSEEDVRIEAENVELPYNYVEDSFEIVQIIENKEE